MPDKQQIAKTTSHPAGDFRTGGHNSASSERGQRGGGERLERAVAKEAKKATAATTINGITINVQVLQNGGVVTETTQKGSKSKPEQAGKKPYKKKGIPSAVKLDVWNKYIGEEKRKAKCLCCHQS